MKMVEVMSRKQTEATHEMRISERSREEARQEELRISRE